MNKETRDELTKIEEDKDREQAEEQNREADESWYCYKYGPCKQCKGE